MTDLFSYSKLMTSPAAALRPVPFRQGCLRIRISLLVNLSLPDSRSSAEGTRTETKQGGEDLDWKELLA